MKIFGDCTFFLAFMLSLLLISCRSDRNNRIYLYSKDKTQVITVISDYEKNERIVALGKVENKPEKDYVTLDISEVTEIGDEIGICWYGKNNGWQFVNDESKIAEVRLDTLKYVFKTSWYNDKSGIPNALYYRKENCYTIGMLNYGNPHPQGNGYVIKE